MPLPPIAEQSDIAAVLFGKDAENSALERPCNKTRAIRQGMMLLLLTDSIRLPIPEVPAEEEPSP